MRWACVEGLSGWALATTSLHHTRTCFPRAEWSELRTHLSSPECTTAATAIVHQWHPRRVRAAASYLPLPDETAAVPAGAEKSKSSILQHINTTFNAPSPLASALARQLASGGG